MLQESPKSSARSGNLLLPIIDAYNKTLMYVTVSIRFLNSHIYAKCIYISARVYEQ